MELQLTSEQKVLIDEKNQLVDETVEKYRAAGQMAQSGLAYIISYIKDRAGSSSSTLGDICRVGDAFLNKAVNDYNSDEEGLEKGIALPVQIEKGAYVNGMAPEEGREYFQGGHINDGDVIKITVGIHIDGYTAQVSHTLLVWDSKPTEPFVGTEADAMIASYLATEAVVSLLSTAVKPENFAVSANMAITGTRIRSVVERIAKTYRVKVCPGSRVRRVRRFLAGQSKTINESDLKGVEWDEEEENEYEIEKLQNASTQTTENKAWEAVHPAEERESFVVQAGEAWLVDIRMAAVEGQLGILLVKPEDSYRTAMYARDFTVTYGLKTKSSKSVASRATSVYPFKLSYLVDDELSLNTAKLGLSELVQHHMFVPIPVETIQFVPWTAIKSMGTVYRNKARKLDSSPVVVAREMATLILVPSEKSKSGYPEVVRLTGGLSTAKPAWTHSKFEIQDEELAALLTLDRNINTTSVKFTDVQPANIAFEAPNKSHAAEMEIDQ